MPLSRALVGDIYMQQILYGQTIGVRGTTVVLSSADLRRALPDYELVNLRP